MCWKNTYLLNPPGHMYPLLGLTLITLLRTFVAS